MRKSFVYLTMSIVLMVSLFLQSTTISYAKKGASTSKNTTKQASIVKTQKKQNAANKKTMMELNVEVASGTGIYEYCFVLVKNQEKIEQTSWSENSTYKWDPSASGSYIVLAAVRDKNKPTRIIHRKAFHFQTPEPLKINTLKINTQRKTVETMATGEGKLKYYYYAVDTNGRKVSLSKQYSTSNIFSIKKLKKASYTIYSKVKDAQNNVATKTISYDNR